MANLNVRIDDEIKNKASKILKNLNISQTKAIQSLYEYIIKNEKLPVNCVDDEDLELLKITKYRLNNPAKRVKVTLDDL